MTNSVPTSPTSVLEMRRIGVIHSPFSEPQGSLHHRSVDVGVTLAGVGAARARAATDSGRGWLDRDGMKLVGVETADGRVVEGRTSGGVEARQLVERGCQGFGSPGTGRKSNVTTW